MMRLSPQDIDRIENERLDAEDRVHFTVPGSSDVMSQGKKHENPEVPPLRNNRHGWKPTLDDMESR